MFSVKKIALLVGACLLFSISSPAQSPPPTIFFTDLDSGPNSGGESVSGFAGAYVTIYGNFFGTSQGSSTITWNGLNCLRVLPVTGNYTGWGMAHLWYQEIIVQIGPTCTAATGSFVVTTTNGSSNGLAFTVRSGNIYCISNSGSDSNSGAFPSSCFATPKFAFTKMNAGDTAYWEGGVVVSSGGSFSALDWGASGTAGNPVAMVSYPGASPQPGVQCNPCQDGYAIRAAQGFPAQDNYLTMAGLFISGDTFAWFSEYGGTNQRFVGNKFTCVGNSAAVGCFQTSQQTFIKYYGNEVTGIVAGTQSGGNGTSKQYHAVYFCTDTNHIEEAWNSIHDNLSCNATQVHSSPVNGTTGFDQYDISIHDNLVHDEPCTAFLLATVDPSQGKVELYNNVIYHVGIGPAPADGEESETCFRFAQIINNSPPLPSGTAEVYNNTCVDAGSFVGAFGHSGSLGLDSGSTDIAVRFRNNIFYQLSGEFFTNSGSVPAANAPPLSGSNNVWFGGNQTAPSFTTGNLTADPLFINRSVNNLHIQTTSEAVKAGTLISNATTYKSYPPYQGSTPIDHDSIRRSNAPSIGAYELGTLPTFVYSAVAPLAIPSGSGFSGPSSCTSGNPCYRIPVDPTAITAGSTILLSFGYDSTSSNQVFTVTDDQSDTYTLDVTSSQSNNKTLKIYRAVNVAAGVHYINVQLTSGAANGYWQGQVAVFYNANSLDVASCNAATSTTVSAGSMVVTTSGDLIFQATYASAQNSESSFTVGSQTNISWNLASTLLGDGAASQYGVYNSTSAINPTFTQASSNAYISCAVALLANATGSAPTTIPRVVHQEHDAMPKNSASPWHVGFVLDVPNSAVYLSYVGNDSISSVSSSPSPTGTAWTASGSDFTGLNGHNHVNFYCASWTSPPGFVNLSISRGGTSNDSINMIYVVQNATCNLDVDSAGQSGNQTSAGSLTVCTSCLTPTKQNDFIMSEGGQAFCTATSATSPSNANFSTVWYTGNTVDGPTQTDENNFWSFLYNGSSLSAFTITYAESCDNPQGDWANRVAAYQSSANVAASVPTFSPVAGTYGGAQSVTLSTSSSGAVICYTTNGTTPTTNGTTGCTAGTLYSAAIVVNTTETIEAVAGGTGYTDSGIGTAAYTINATPLAAAPSIFAGNLNVSGQVIVK